MCTCPLLAVVVLFFHKPLFSAEYTFPWDFRGVQLPLITVLRDQLRENHFALWNPYTYCGYPIFANIQACFFHPSRVGKRIDQQPAVVVKLAVELADPAGMDGRFCRCGSEASRPIICSASSICGRPRLGLAR